MKAGDPCELLALLRDDGCLVSIADGQLAFNRLPPWARLVSRASWQLLAVVLQGAEGRVYGYRDASGKKRMKTVRHAWMRCDVCGAGTMRAKGAGPKRCVMTPNCSGKHRS